MANVNWASRLKLWTWLDLSCCPCVCFRTPAGPEQSPGRSSSHGENQQAETDNPLKGETQNWHTGPSTLIPLAKANHEPSPPSRGGKCTAHLLGVGRLQSYVAKSMETGEGEEAGPAIQMSPLCHSHYAPPSIHSSSIDLRVSILPRHSSHL